MVRAQKEERGRRADTSASKSGREDVRERGMLVQLHARREGQANDRHTSTHARAYIHIHIQAYNTQHACGENRREAKGIGKKRTGMTAFAGSPGRNSASLALQSDSPSTAHAGRGRGRAAGQVGSCTAGSCPRGVRPSRGARVRVQPHLVYQCAPPPGHTAAARRRTGYGRNRCRRP